MYLLILGLALWSFTHLFKRLMPEARERLGDRGKGPIALLLVLAVALMVLGYRSAPLVPVYTPLPGMGHLNNALMMVSLFLFGVGGTKGTLYPRLRHPMLLGLLVWAAAHLLVNGDAASILLFGGLAAWALVEMALINRAGAWIRPGPGRGLKGDAMNIAGTLLLFAAIAGVHIWLGRNPFLGTYG